jgi:hypothetical protein
VPNDTAAGPHRIERALVAAAATVIGLSVLALIAVLIIAGTGAQLDQSLFTTVRLIPLIGLPIGALLIVAFVIATGVRRQREVRDAGR